MDYFPHDSHAMSDDKLLALRIDKGLGAVAVYWCLLEKIYGDERPFDVSETNVEARSVLLRLGVGFDVLSEYVSHMCEIGLLERDPENPNLVTSKRAVEHIEELNRKREIARQNGKNGGRKPKAKRSGNQRKTNVGSKEKPKSGDIKTLNVIGLDKLNQITEASDGAAAAGAAPPSAPDDSKVPVCPLCSKPVRFDPRTMSWKCGMCGDVKEPSFVEPGDAA
jgi:hypothetical protein